MAENEDVSEYSNAWNILAWVFYVFLLQTPRVPLYAIQVELYVK